MITSTELRTKMPEVIATLMAGGKIDLIHRSKVVGEIAPVKHPSKPFNAKRIKQLVEKMNLKSLNDKEIDRKYRKYLNVRYGKYLPRHK